MKHGLSLLILLIGLGCALLTACRPSPTAAEEGRSIAFAHATLLRMYDCDGYLKAVVRNPWDTTRVLHTYYLVDREKELPSRLPADGTLVRTPLQRVVAFSSVHAGLMRRLGCLKALAGVCDGSYVMDSVLRERLADGRLTDFGNSQSPNVEALLLARPDALLVSPFENSGGYGRIEQMQTALVECADYMEASPLGRAEWMRFFGRLFGCASQADSLFSEVERNYLKWKAVAAKAPERPRLLTERKEGASWYVAGGNSTMGRLYADAGADYAFADYRQTGSVRLNFETVYNTARDADLWLIKYGQTTDLTYEQLARDYRPHTGFRAWKERHIYGCNTLHVAFYEEAPFRPDLLLAELVSLFHPRADLSVKPRYFTPLHEK